VRQRLASQDLATASNPKPNEGPETASRK
jgi:hypothetical protein